MILNLKFIDWILYRQKVIVIPKISQALWTGPFPNWCFFTTTIPNMWISMVLGRNPLELKSPKTSHTIAIATTWDADSLGLGTRNCELEGSWERFLNWYAFGFRCLRAVLPWQTPKRTGKAIYIHGIAFVYCGPKNPPKRWVRISKTTWCTDAFQDCLPITCFSVSRLGRRSI